MNSTTVCNDTIAPHDKKKWKIIASIAIVVAIFGVGLSLFLIIEKQQDSDKIADLTLKAESLQEQLSQKTPDDTQNSEQYSSTEDDNNGDSDANNISSQKYLEPEGWDVRFAYPNGVTDAEYSVQDDLWDGALFIYSITKDGKTYDVNLFGGKESYRHYPFFFGEVARWNDVSPRNSWSGVIVDMDLILTSGDYKYYAWDKGNGYETGDASTYDEACQIVGELLRNIEAR